MCECISWKNEQKKNESSAISFMFSCNFFFVSFNLHRDDNRPEEQTNDVGGVAGMDVDGVIESNWNELVDNFDDMNLKQELLRGIYGYGFERPSAIQQRAILPCIRQYDVIAQAQSGKEKLFCFPFNILPCIPSLFLNVMFP